MAAPCPKRRKLDHNEDKSEAAIQLPEDAIQEILVRLPTKSIRRFQSTCKSWYALIRSRSFINFHTRFHRHVDYLNQLLFYDQGEHNHHVYALDSSSFQSTPVFEIEKLLKTIKSVTPAEVRVTLTRFGIDLPLETIAQVFEPCISVLGPLSNGIYCVVARVYARTTNYVAYGYSNAAFCNPATGEFKLISPPHLSKVICPGPHVCKVWKVILPVTRRSFAKHLLEVKHHYGFGSIIQKKGTRDIVVDYKMVMIIQDSEWFKAFVYSQRRGSWKLICDCDCDSGSFQFPTITQDLDFLPQANLNGSCHWMTDEHHSILRFDLASEEFGMIPGPPDDDYINHHPVRPGVFVLNDRLAAIIIRYRLPVIDFYHGVFSYACDIDVWMMKEYGVEESWTKIHSCQFEIGNGLRLQKFLGMSFSKDNSTIERMFFQVKRGELLSYDCVGGVVERHSIFGRIVKEDPTVDRFSFSLKTSFDDDEDGGIPWKNHLAPLEAVHSLTCWKTIGLSTYVETLEPVTLDIDEDEDTRQQRCNRNGI